MPEQAARIQFGEGKPEGSGLSLIKELPINLQTTVEILAFAPRFKSGQRFGEVPGSMIKGYTPARLGRVLENLLAEVTDHPDFATNDKVKEQFLENHAIPDFDHLSLAVLDATKYLAGDSARTTGTYYWKKAEDLRTTIARGYPEKTRTSHVRIPVKASIALASFALAVEGCAGIGPKPVVPETPIPGITEIAPALVGDLISIARATQSLEPWQTFTIGGHTMQRTGEIVPPLSSVDSSKLITMYPPNADGSPNNKIAYTLVGTTLTVDGKEYPTSFLIKEEDGTTTAYLLQPVIESSDATKTTYKVGKLDSTHTAFLDPDIFIVEGTKFYFVKNGVPQPHLVGPQAEPTAAAQIVNAVFKVSSGVEVPVPLTPTPDTSVAPVVEVIPKDQMDTIVAKMNTDLKGGYILSPNPDGTYAIKGPDGTAVNNIRLNVDGKVNLTLPDGTTEVLPAETVFMPSKPDTIYAALYQLNVKAGVASEIPYADTTWPKDPEHQSPRITPDMLPLYNRWIRDQLEKTGELDRQFAAADTGIKWQVEEQGFVLNADRNGDGVIDKTKAQTLAVQGDLSAITPFRLPYRTSFGSFVSIVENVKKIETSLFPIIAENADPSQERYSLFPTKTDTKYINNTKIGAIASLRTLLDQVETVIGNPSNPPVRYVAFVGPYLEAPSNMDAAGNVITARQFLQGTNPAEEAARMKILQNGASSGSFAGSDKYMWVIADYEFAHQ